MGSPFADDGNGSDGGFAQGHVGGDREPGAVVDELEDHAFAAARVGGYERYEPER